METVWAVRDLKEGWGKTVSVIILWNTDVSK